MIERELILFTLLILISVSMLIYVGEVRPDAYLAVAILVYFIYTSVNYSFRSKIYLKPVDIILITVFAIIVAYKLYGILR
ncbi:MAG: hypothetical protein QXO98_00595 [Sulfolobales archaeon]